MIASTIIFSIMILFLFSVFLDVQAETIPSENEAKQERHFIRTNPRAMRGENFGSLNQASLDSYEPDNNRTLSKEILTNSTQTHSIYPVGDVDWLFFEINETLRIQIETNGSRGYDTAIKLFDSLGRLLQYNDDGGDYLYSRIITTLKSGRYYIYVESFGNSSEIPAYNITVRALSLEFLPPSFDEDIYEPDNEYSLAVPISSGETVTRSISPGNDTDWFVFEVQNASFAEITTMAPRIEDTVLSLYDENLVLIAENDDQIFLLAGIFQYVSPGIYYFRVTSYAQSDSINEYQVSLRLIENGPDQYEGDDSEANATEITNGGTQFHTLYPNDDLDIVKFVLDKPSFVYISLGNWYVPGQDYVWWKEGENHVINDPFYEPRLLEAGTYYLQIFSTAPNNAMYNYYYLTVYWKSARTHEFSPDNSQLFINGTIGFQEFPFEAFLANFTESFEVTATLGSNYTEDEYGLHLRFDDGEGHIEYASFGRRYNTSVFSIDPNKMYEIVLFKTDPFSLYFELNLTAKYYEPDEFEPDNSPENATRITLVSGEQKHSLVPSDDVDWFAFEITSEKALIWLEIEVRKATTQGVARAQFFDKNMRLITEAIGNRSLYVSPATPLERGVYYLAVQNLGKGKVLEYVVAWQLTDKFINVVYPATPGLRFEIGSEIRIEWWASGVERFTIHLIEAGYFTPQQVIVKDFEGTAYSWTIEGVSPGPYMFVIFDASDSGIKADSAIFRIIELPSSSQQNGGGGFFRISFAFDSVLFGVFTTAFLVSVLTRSRSLSIKKEQKRK